jgi:formyltetrahydrofolate synthetase
LIDLLAAQWQKHSTASALKRKDVSFRAGCCDLGFMGFDRLPICMAKTQYSFSHDATLKGE